MFCLIADGSAPCPACAAAKLQRWRPATATEPRLAEFAYELARCPACGTAVTAPGGPDPLASGLYEGMTYSEPRSILNAAIEPLRRLADLDRLRFMRGLPAGARVFEAGAGDGRFLKLLEDRGFVADGIEPAPALCRRAVARGAHVRCVELGETRLEERTRDAIVAWHVLEHLDAPGAALERLRPALSPQGRMLIAVPNIASLQARVGGDAWFHQDVPRHRTHFTVTGIRRLLERSGFEVRRVSHILVEQNALGMWQSLLNQVTTGRNVAFRALKRDLGSMNPRARRRDLAVTLALGGPLAPLAIALELAAGLARHGGTVVIDARVRG